MDAGGGFSLSGDAPAWFLLCTQEALWAGVTFRFSYGWQVLVRQFRRVDHFQSTVDVLNIQTLLKTEYTRPPIPKYNVENQGPLAKVL